MKDTLTYAHITYFGEDTAPKKENKPVDKNK